MDDNNTVTAELDILCIPVLQVPPILQFGGVTDVRGDARGVLLDHCKCSAHEAISNGRSFDSNSDWHADSGGCYESIERVENRVAHVH